jgi:hypothetical protein
MTCTQYQFLSQPFPALGHSLPPLLLSRDIITYTHTHMHALTVGTLSPNPPSPTPPHTPTTHTEHLIVHSTGDNPTCTHHPRQQLLQMHFWGLPVFKREDELKSFANSVLKLTQTHSALWKRQGKKGRRTAGHLRVHALV